MPRPAGWRSTSLAMALPAEVRQRLPTPVADTWERIAPLLRGSLYLAGGTALVAHLGHRESHDLDFFFHARAVDLDALADRLEGAGAFAVLSRSSGTLNGTFERTRVQFLHADEERPQRRLEPTARVGGIELAGIGDLIAMKLAAVGGRPALRDYFDLMAIERVTGRGVEEGLGLYLARYEPADPLAPAHVVRSLGYLDDVEDDDLVPASRSEIASYWERRQPAITASLANAASVAAAIRGRPWRTTR